jgi:hypothetical protein
MPKKFTSLGKKTHENLAAVTEAGRWDASETWILADTKGQAENYGRR